MTREYGNNKIRNYLLGIGICYFISLIVLPILPQYVLKKKIFYPGMNLEISEATFKGITNYDFSTDQVTMTEDFKRFLYDTEELRSLFKSIEYKDLNDLLENDGLSMRIKKYREIFSEYLSSELEIYKKNQQGINRFKQNKFVYSAVIPLLIVLVVLLFRFRKIYLKSKEHKLEQKKIEAENRRRLKEQEIKEVENLLYTNIEEAKYSYNETKRLQSKYPELNWQPRLSHLENTIKKFEEENFFEKRYRSVLNHFDDQPLKEKHKIKKLLLQGKEQENFEFSNVFETYIKEVTKRIKVEEENLFTKYYEPELKEFDTNNLADLKKIKKFFMKAKKKEGFQSSDIFDQKLLELEEKIKVETKREKIRKEIGTVGLNGGKNKTNQLKQGKQNSGKVDHQSLPQSPFK